jgi:hypothetical protein
LEQTVKAEKTKAAATVEELTAAHAKALVWGTEITCRQARKWQLTNPA